MLSEKFLSSRNERKFSGERESCGGRYVIVRLMENNLRVYKNPLYIKTFFGNTRIAYKQTTIRPAQIESIVGLVLLAVLVLYVITMNTHGLRFTSTIISCVMLVCGFVSFYWRVLGIGREIKMAIKEGREILETEYSFDGSKKWFPLSPFVGGLLGISIFQIANRYMGRYPVGMSGLIVGIMAFGAGGLLAIGVAYTFWEFKFKRKIMVYRYDQVEKSV